MTTIDQRVTPENFIDVQVALLTAGDTTGLSERYAPDAEFVRLDRIARGRAEIKALFDDYVAENPELGELDGYQITADVMLYQVPEKIAGVQHTAVGTIVFKDGLVWRQTAAFVPADR